MRQHSDTPKKSISNCRPRILSVLLKIIVILMISCTLDILSMYNNHLSNISSYSTSTFIVMLRGYLLLY